MAEFTYDNQHPQYPQYNSTGTVLLPHALGYLEFEEYKPDASFGIIDPTKPPPSQEESHPHRLVVLGEVTHHIITNPFDQQVAAFRAAFHNYWDGRENGASFWFKNDDPNFAIWSGVNAHTGRFRLAAIKGWNDLPYGMYAGGPPNPLLHGPRRLATNLGMILERTGQIETFKETYSEWMKAAA